MGNSTWLSGGESVPASSKKKLVFVAEIKVTEEMPEGQKGFARAFNDMRAALLENGLMNKK